jgi:hypothetical protein
MHALQLECFGMLQAEESFEVAQTDPAQQLQRQPPACCRVEMQGRRKR